MLRGSSRQRYMTRQRDPNDQTVILPGTTVWTQYSGKKPYMDYTVDDEGVVTDTKAYELGIGQVDLVSGETSYFHTDQIGSTRLMTDSLGTIHESQVHTAFGEKLSSDLDTRYGYAGAWGYEDLTADGFSLSANLMHVGARTYDPSLGRFLQRDPIGITGSLNVYAYVGNNPLSNVDPQNLASWPIYVFEGLCFILTGYTAYQLGEKIAEEIYGPKSGRLWIDPDGTIHYPNGKTERVGRKHGYIPMEERRREYKERKKCREMMKWRREWFRA